MLTLYNNYQYLCCERECQEKGEGWKENAIAINILYVYIFVQMNIAREILENAVAIQVI